MELVDALYSYAEANSVVELSLAPCFRRGHASLYMAIADYEWEKEMIATSGSTICPAPLQKTPCIPFIMFRR